jgi:hypothetical protein
MTTRKKEIARYVWTGDCDQIGAAWPGDLWTRIGQSRADLRAALVAEVHHRSDGTSAPALPKEFDPVLFARAKVAPMVRGLFPRREQDIVLAVLDRSVVFLTKENIDEVLTGAQWPRTAWALANLYLASLGQKLLGPDAPRIVGLSEGTTCYVSLEYFQETNRFADFVVHEVAHIFHNCKRGTIGLPQSRSKEWLLDIEFRKREGFAYACEAYSRILEPGNRPAVRRELLAEHAASILPPAECVDPQEYLAILGEAVTAHNGWKRILARCARRSPVKSS